MPISREDYDALRDLPPSRRRKLQEFLKQAKAKLKKADSLRDCIPCLVQKLHDDFDRQFGERFVTELDRVTDGYDEGGKQYNREHDGKLMFPKPDGSCGFVDPNKAEPLSSLQSAEASQKKAPSAECAEQFSENPKTTIYTNGIQNSPAEMCQSLHAIAKTTCGRVVGVYNASTGFVGDVLETKKDRELIKKAEAEEADRLARDKGIPVPASCPPPVPSQEASKKLAQDGRNKAVDTLSDIMFEMQRTGKGADRVEFFAHSQGGAITSLALCDARNRLKAADAACPPGRRDLEGLTVKSFASAAPRWPDGPNYTHFVHEGDATPVILGLGKDQRDFPKTAGKGATVVVIGGNPAADSPVKAKAFRDGKEIPIKDVNGQTVNTAKPDGQFIPSLKKHHNMVETYVPAYGKLKQGRR